MKPRRGRKLWGTIHQMAMDLNVTDQIIRAAGAHAPTLLGKQVFRGYLGGTAGMSLHSGDIELHDVLFTDLPSNELKCTFLHEVGHSLDRMERGKSNHDRPWRNVMSRLGQPGEERCHSIPGSTMRQAKVQMECNRCYKRENTIDPKNQEGRCCRRCPSGRMKVVR